MSVDEEVELKNLIAQTLKSNGTLAKIKAQLRASIFLALDEDEKISAQKPLLNNKIESFMASDEGKAMFYIVHEFLEYFNLCFTLAVFEPESYIDINFQNDEKQRLLHQFGLRSSEGSNDPLLLQLLKIAHKTKRSVDVNINVPPPASVNNSESFESTELRNNSSESICDEVKMGVNLNELNQQNLNSTYNANSPLFLKVITNTSAQNNENNGIKEPDTNNRNPIESTYEQTSSLSEDTDSVSVKVVPEIKVNGFEEPESINKEKINDKPKLSPKSDKLKPKTNLSSLSDLPPLNKSRVSDILPSLYNKDFKDKSNLRELDKLFDMDCEYEEDFMYSGDDLSLKSDQSTNTNLLEELQQSNKKDKTAVLSRIETLSKTPSRIIADCKFKTNGNQNATKTNHDSTDLNSNNPENLHTTLE